MENPVKWNNEENATRTTKNLKKLFKLIRNIIYLSQIYRVFLNAMSKLIVIIF